MLLLCYYYDTTKILLYIDIPVSSLILFFRYAMSGNFSFFLHVFAKKIKNDTGERKKG